jgi:hypothetical protein
MASGQVGFDAETAYWEAERSARVVGLRGGTYRGRECVRSQQAPGCPNRRLKRDVQRPRKRHGQRTSGSVRPELGKAL